MAFIKYRLWPGNQEKSEKEKFPPLNIQKKVEIESDFLLMIFKLKDSSSNLCKRPPLNKDHTVNKGHTQIILHPKRNKQRKRQSILQRQQPYNNVIECIPVTRVNKLYSSWMTSFQRTDCIDENKLPNYLRTLYTLIPVIKENIL